METTGFNSHGFNALGHLDDGSRVHGSKVVSKAQFSNIAFAFQMLSEHSQLKGLSDQVVSASANS